MDVDGEPPLILDLGTGLRVLGDLLAASTAMAATASAPTAAPASAAQPDGPHSAPAPLHARALLTHLHYDHLLGLPFFAPLRAEGSSLDVYGPAQGGPTLRDTIVAAVQPPFFPVPVDQLAGELRFHDVTGPDELTFGSLTVMARDVPHCGRTMGFRVEAEGQAVAYLPDHQAPRDGVSVDDGVLALCDGADLVVHDAQFTGDEYEAMSDWGHSTVEYAVHVAAEAGAQRLVLFHHAPSHTDDDIDRMLARAQELGAQRGLGAITAASEGMTIDLGKR